MSHMLPRMGIFAILSLLFVRFAAFPSLAAHLMPLLTTEETCLPSIKENLSLPDTALQALGGYYDSAPILNFFNEGGTVERLQATLEDPANESIPDVWQIFTQDITSDSIPEIFLAITNFSDSDDAGESHMVMFRCVDDTYQEVVLYPRTGVVSRADGLYDGKGAHILRIDDLTANGAPDILFQVDWKDNTGEYAEYYIYEWKNDVFYTLIEFWDDSRQIVHSINGERNIVIEDLNGDGTVELVMDGRTYRWIAGIGLYFADSFPAATATPLLDLLPVIEKECVTPSNQNLPLPAGVVEWLIGPYDPEPMLMFFNNGGTVETLRDALDGAGNEFGLYLWQVVTQDITGDGIPEIFVAVTNAFASFYGDSNLVMFRCMDGAYQARLLFRRAGAGSRAEGLYSGGGAHIVSIADLNANGASDIIIEVDWEDNYGQYVEYYILEWREDSFHSLVEYQNIFNETVYWIGGQSIGNIQIEDLDGDGLYEIIVDDVTYRWDGTLYTREEH